MSGRNKAVRERCSTRYWVYFRTRRLCDDLAARAFAALPAARRAELLAPART